MRLGVDPPDSRIAKSPAVSSAKRSIQSATRHAKPSASADTSMCMSAGFPWFVFAPDGPPMSPIAFDQRIGFHRSLAARGIDRSLIDPIRGPGIQYRLDDSPARFAVVGALKQSRIPLHSVIAQRLI